MIRLRHLLPLLAFAALVQCSSLQPVAAQNVNYENSPEYKAALQKLVSDLKRELDIDADMLDDAKMLLAMQRAGVNSCLMKIWRESAPDVSGQQRYTLTMQQTQDLNSRIEFIENYLRGFSGDASERRDLAVRIARDADSTIDVMKKVVPEFEKYFGNNKQGLSQGLKLATTFYDNAFESICAKASKLQAGGSSAADFGKSILESGGSSNRYAANRASYDGSPRPAYVPTPQEAKMTIPELMQNAERMIQSGQPIYARVVQSESHLCPYAKMIHKCYEFSVQQNHNGRPQLFHGNLYADCEGYIMVEHRKQ